MTYWYALLLNWKEITLRYHKNIPYIILKQSSPALFDVQKWQAIGFQKPSLTIFFFSLSSRSSIFCTSTSSLPGAGEEEESCGGGLDTVTILPTSFLLRTFSKPLCYSLRMQCFPWQQSSLVLIHERTHSLSNWRVGHFQFLLNIQSFTESI